MRFLKSCVFAAVAILGIALPAATSAVAQRAEVFQSRSPDYSGGALAVEIGRAHV